ncbi:MAG TPA: LacI family DNA-binding transcriptional regulator [Candidatus Caccocola faecipullorum]|nr:LacI family DNA-binding transcriptional regulator [Candidatus Caccocola faecipullorum]
MQDVADRAGVDKATVSRVLRGDHRISEKTKIKVMESVRALDYRLDRNARNLSTKSSGLAGVVARGLTEPWAGAFVAGLERALSNSGYDVILKSTDGAAVRAKRAAEALDGLGAEGVIWCDGENFPGALSMPALCFGFTREGFHSLVMEEGGAPSFETGVLAARLLLKIIAGKPVPGKELRLKAPEKED